LVFSFIYRPGIFYFPCCCNVVLAI